MCRRLFAQDGRRNGTCNSARLCGDAKLRIAIIGKGVIIDSCSIRKEREILPLNFSTKIAIKDVYLEKEMRGKMPILKIRDAKNRKNFTLGFPYAQRDIIFIEMLIYEMLNKIAKFDPQKKISKDPK